jgi:hypothetical protein
MALDIYVMPIWRFKVRDFSSPIESKLGIRPKVVSPNGIQEPPAKAGWIARWRARRQVAAIRKAVEAANGTSAHWRDDGEVVYAEQSHGIEPLRTFASWLDLRDRMPEFRPPPEGNYYKHPVWDFDHDRPLSCPHLVEHDCHSGYFLPCDFERPVQVEPYRIHSWSFSRCVGSTVRVRKELAFLAEHLSVPDDHVDTKDDPKAKVKTAFLQMQQVVDLSLLHGLPVIFRG